MKLHYTRYKFYFAYFVLYQSSYIFFLLYTKRNFFKNVLIQIHEASHTIFGIIVDRQTGSNIRDIFSLQITVSWTMTSIKLLCHSYLKYVFQSNITMY